jgi:hypothetical protein
MQGEVQEAPIKILITMLYIANPLEVSAAVRIGGD